jgi:cellulose synthase/poly-beta-1,6-N-acetylglucosamine synthase-like glycosyltransferase
MLYAEHPENQDVAIFGTLIEPWNDENQFASLQSVMARLGWREALRVNNRIDCTLAVGHNEIYRTAAIREVGGFNEHYVAEDTATCIEVLQKGWRCLTIPVKSYERVPSNLCEFQKRRARHACQTFQLGTKDLTKLPWTTRMRLVKGLHFHSLPIVFIFGGLLLSGINCWTFFRGEELYQGKTASFGTNYWNLGFWLCFALLPLLIVICRATAEGIRPTESAKSILFELGAFVTTSWRVTYHIACYWYQRRLVFTVTGVEHTPSLGEIFAIGGPGLWLCWLSLLSLFFRPVLSGLNFIWLLPACLAPFILHHYQRTRRV